MAWEGLRSHDFTFRTISMNSGINIFGFSNYNDVFILSPR